LGQPNTFLAEALAPPALRRGLRLRHRSGATLHKPCPFAEAEANSCCSYLAPGWGRREREREREGTQAAAIPYAKIFGANATEGTLAAFVAAMKQARLAV
jgi:hypothetical protein